MAMITKRTVPNLVLAQRVVDKMSEAAKRYIADETGEALIGLVIASTQPGGTPTVYVLDTIGPDDTAGDAPVREWGKFEQGDELQQEKYWWLIDNWDVYRNKRRLSYGNAVQAKWDAPLIHVGDWHKQPGYMIKPSFGDLITALDMLDDDERELEFLLAPIVTLDHPSTTENKDGTSVNYITISTGSETDIRVDFWYIHEDVRMFEPIIPTIVPDHDLPGLPHYPWQFMNIDRFNTETKQLHADGLFTSVTHWEADDRPPMEICFMTARRGTNKVLIVITQWDYPKTAPTARIAPFIQMGEGDDIYEIFQQLWEQSTPVKNPSGWKWSEEKFLIDYVHAVENSLGLRPAEEVKSVAVTPSVESVKEDAGQEKSDEKQQDVKVEADSTE